MGSVGTRKNTSSMSVNDFQLEDKKWGKRERANFEKVIPFMSDNFGDIRDLIGNIYRRSSSTIHAAGLYDRDGAVKNERATYFATDNYASEEHLLHEFTHAITEEIASHYKELGYESRSDVLNAMRTEIHQNLGKEEGKYDGRTWRDRPEEFLSRFMEYNTSDRRAKGFKPGDISQETLKVIKKWFKKVR